jgi:hypothetical protein
MQNGMWQPAFLPLPNINPAGAEFSEAVEFDKYFKTKKEADEYVFKYLTEEKGITENDIQK